MKKYQDFKNIATMSPRLFRKKVEFLNGAKITMFSYSKEGVTYNDFKEYDAFDMRGVTFVDDNKGRNIFPMLFKFFNYKEVPALDEDKIVKYIQEKFDGSLVGFIIVNGEVFSKTKTGLSNEFTEIANLWVKSEKEKIIQLYNKGYCPLFEVVSHNHKIVVEYEKEELKLLQIVNLEGELMDLGEVQEIADSYGWDFKAPIDKTLDEVLSEKATEKGKEGYIVTYTDGSLAKIKTDWYFERHVESEGNNRANAIIKLACETGRDKEDNYLDYENIFLENVFNKILKKADIKSVKELKYFIFKTGNKVDVETYLKHYRDFMREYALDKNIKNENTKIKHILSGTVDDILPTLNDEDRLELIEIQTLVLNYFNNVVEKVITFQGLEKSSPYFQDMQKNNKDGKDLFLKAYYKKLSRLEIEDLLRKMIIHQNRKRDKAKAFVKVLKKNKV